MVRTKCCKCLKPGSSRACAVSILASGVVVINSTRGEKELSRIGKELK